MQPQGQGPDIQALLSQLGGGQDAPQDAPSPQGNWLVDAINAVHDGMVEETDPQIVSLLGSIIDKLTTVQAKVAAPTGQAPVG